MNDEYDLKSAKLPYLSGAALQAFAALLESPLGALLRPSLFESAGLNWLRAKRLDEPITPLPIRHAGYLAAQDSSVPLEKLPEARAGEARGFRFLSAFDYAAAYRAGKITPDEVAQNILEAIEASDKANPPLRAVIASYRNDVLRAAREASIRFKNGKPLSVLDGVPIAVKDEVDMAGYPTAVGTSFLGKEPAQQDSAVVERLRAAGALLVGKTNMHEIGIGVTGLTPHYGVARNPYNVRHFTGGSSSGSAAAVAAGLVPIAVGADGGGSIRIPAAFCGVFGLKPTFGRVSERGAFPLDWSVAHLGPIAATASDLALGYGAMAGADLNDPHSLHQPAPTLEGWNTPHLRGVKLGVYRKWFEHAEKGIVEACEITLKRFVEMGAEIREVVIPELELNRVAHTVVIVSEMAQAMSHTYKEHRREHGLDVRVNLALGNAFTARDYVQAQRARTRVIRHFDEALRETDAIITPTTAIPAPTIPNAALPRGESDLTTTIEIMRFVTAANMTGLPAVSFPVGYTQSGLPIGMQAIGKAWQETLLLRLALNAEAFVERKKPQIHYQIL